MKLFVSALEYSANVHLKYLLREMVEWENIELCGIFDEKMLGNSSLDLHSADLINCHKARTQSPLSLCQFTKNHESQTENPSVVDSALCAESRGKIMQKNAESTLDSANPNKNFCYFWLIPKVESPLPLNSNLISEAISQNLAKKTIEEMVASGAALANPADCGGGFVVKNLGCENGLRVRERSKFGKSMQDAPKTKLPAESSKFYISGTSLCDTNSLAVMGFIDVLKKARFFLDLRKKCLNLALNADKILLMDSSSFNIPLAKRIKKCDKNKQIMYYILPQVWAWKPWRARAIEENCDKLVAILPFEVGCYKKKAKFVGHPLLDEIKYFKSGNSPLDLHSADLINCHKARTQSPLSLCQFTKNHESQTENPSVVDSAHSAESSENKSKNPAKSAESNNNISRHSELSQESEESKKNNKRFVDSSRYRAQNNESSADSAKTQNLIKNNLTQSVRKSFCYFWLLPKVESPLPLKPNPPKIADSANATNFTESSIFSFMPGSRLGEIRRIFPIFLQVKDELKKRDKSAKFHLIIPQKFATKNLSEIYGDLSDFHISFDAHRSLFQSRFAFICSGTATLECALIGTPFVLGYKCRAFEAFIARCFLKIKFIGLANILYEKIAPNKLFHTELIQQNLTAKNLLHALDSANSDEFLQKSLALRKYLKCGSAKSVAKMLYDL